jgi:hypothetical protein
MSAHCRFLAGSQVKDLRELPIAVLCRRMSEGAEIPELNPSGLPALPRTANFVEE